MRSPLASKAELSFALSAGIIPVRRKGDEWLYLILRAYAYWDFPKGLVEPGEDPWQAAVRELREETGISALKPRWGERYYETAPYSRGKVARYYIAEAESAEIRLSFEHHESRWVTVTEARKLLVPRVRAALDWAAAQLHV